MPEVSPYGELNWEQIENMGRIVAAAKRFGVPEQVLLGVLWHEGKFRTNPGGNGGGLGQMLESTARGMSGNKIGQKELIDNPELAAELSAKYLADEGEAFGGDWEKAAAAYFGGRGTVQAAEQMGGNWLANADQLMQKYNQGSMSDYLASTNAFTSSSSTTGLKSKSSEDILKEVGWKGAGEAKVSKGYDPKVPPSIEDFQYIDETGAKVTDHRAYYETLKSWQETRQLDREYNLGPVSQYVDDVISQLSAEIASGRLNLDKANSLFDARLKSYKTAIESYSSDAFKYGTPAGASHVQGREPGGFWESRGLGSLPAQQSPVLDPMAEALSQYKQAKSSIGAVNTPPVPNYAEMRKTEYAKADPAEQEYRNQSMSLFEQALNTIRTMGRP